MPTHDTALRTSRQVHAHGAARPAPFRIVAGRPGALHAGRGTTPGMAALTALAIATTAGAALTGDRALLAAIGPAFAAVVCWPRMVRNGLAAGSVAGEPAGLAAFLIAQALGLAAAVTLGQIMQGQGPVAVAVAQITLVPMAIDLIAEATCRDWPKARRTTAADSVALRSAAAREELASLRLAREASAAPAGTPWRAIELAPA